MTTKLTFGEHSFSCADGQTVLDCLTANGVAIPSGCRSGVCQTCLMSASAGDIPARAQDGLSAAQLEQRCFMACVCRPVSDLTVALPTAVRRKLSARVTAILPLNGDILGVQLLPGEPFSYRAGQFINLYKDDSTSRSYSLASVPTLDAQLQLHVRKVPGGLVSGWIFDQLRCCDSVTISEPSGDCIYTAGQPEQNLLLIGTGSGLAPLYGVIRDALSQGHRGQIRLYHGAYQANGLYLVEALRALSKRHPNFSYTPCLSDGAATEGCRHGMVLDVALQDLPSLAGWRVYLCGNPAMVEAAKPAVFLAGASMREIFADPF